VTAFGEASTTSGAGRCAPRRRSTILLDGIGLPQSLRWHDDALWFSDQAHDAVHRWDGTDRVVAEVPGPGGIGFLPDGRLLVLSVRDNRLYRQESDGRLLVHADLSEHVEGPVNDMLVDPHGRAYVGNYGFDFEALTRDAPHSALYAPPGPPSTALVLIDPDGTVIGRSAPVLFPNGACWLDGGATLLVCETLAFRLTAFPVGPDGQLGHPRVWASLIDDWLWRAVNAPGVVGTITRGISTLLDHPVIADRSSSPIAPEDVSPAGDGTVWVANALRGEAVRIAEGGNVVERVATTQHTLGITRGGHQGNTVIAATVATLDPEEAGRLDAGRIEYFDRNTTP